MRESCENCRFWLKEGTVVRPAENGLCRRFPPVYIEERGVEEYPETMDDDWCGEFQPKKQKSKEP